MPLTDSLRTEIDSLLQDHRVVLFMKGNRRMPQCGFSARVVDILDGVLDEYHTVDVLQRGDIREGIKEFSDWPTLPQLYIGGEFVGGCDIITEMAASGELHQALGVEVETVEAPEITVTDSAREVFLGALEGADQPLRFRIDARYRFDLSFGAKSAGDVEVTANGITLVMDPASARRGGGTVIDYEKSAMGEGFRISNPNEPPKVRQLSVGTLKEWMDEGRDFRLFDVRTPQERTIATLKGDEHLTRGDQLAELPKDVPVILYCHTGGRSQGAAEQVLGMGFTQVYNLAGGINAWSMQVDPSTPRY